MEALRLERERQKRELEQNKSVALSSASVDGKKKFVKRGDIERAKEVEREQVEQERTQKKRKLETDEVAASNAAASRETTPALEQIKFVPLPRDEVVRRLRALVQPITFFGESDEERQRRLHQIELIVSERQSTSSAGAQKNIFQLMSESVDAEIEAAIAAGSHSADDSKDDGANQANRSDDESGDERADDASSSASAVSSLLIRPRIEFSCDEDFGLHYFKCVLKEWEEELEARPEAEKRTAHGKYAKATWHQTRQYLKPLFKQLKRKACPADIVEYVRRIVSFCQAKEYVKANDCYLQMSIGNAPWPMGVSMAGIHERAGRDKLEEKHTAHILNDETQRKFIISIKRLMSFAQSKYPSLSNTQNCG